MFSWSRDKLTGARSGLWLGLYGALLACVYPAYFSAYPLPDFIHKLAALAGASFLLLGFFAVGHALTSYFSGSSRLGPIQWALTQGALGLVVVATVVLACGWLFPGNLKIKLTLLTVALAGLTLRVIFSGHLPTPVFRSLQFSAFETAAAALALGGMAVSFITSFSPITYYDSLVYHLALPAVYNHAGKISAIPFNLYSFFPANTEMIYLYALNQLPQPEYVINLLGWSVSFLISLALAEWAMETGGKKQALWTIVLWWTAPPVLFLSTGAYIDIVLSGFIFLSVRWFIHASEQQWGAPWIGLSGFFSGAAFITKYTGAMCPLILFILMAYFAFVKNIPLRTLLIFSASALGPAIPWLMKNYVFIGNPVFPFFYKWMGANAGWTQSTAAGYFNALIEYGARSRILSDLLLAPLSFGGGFDVLGDFGWPLFLFGAPLACLLGKPSGRIRLLSIYCLGHFLFWLGTKPVLRFLIGALPLLTFLTATSMGSLLEKSGRTMKNVVFLFVCPWILSNFSVYFTVADGLRPFSVALGMETKEAYLSRRLAYYPTFQFANATLTPTDKILLIGEQRTFHLNLPFISSNLFASSPIAETCNNAGSDADLEAFLSDKKISHILINEGEILRLGGLSRFGFSAQGEQHLIHFMNARTSTIFENQRVKLLRLIN